MYQLNIKDTTTNLRSVVINSLIHCYYNVLISTFVQIVAHFHSLKLVNRADKPILGYNLQLHVGPEHAEDLTYNILVALNTTHCC